MPTHLYRRADSHTLIDYFAPLRPEPSVGKRSHRPTRNYNPPRLQEVTPNQRPWFVIRPIATVLVGAHRARLVINDDQLTLCGLPPWGNYGRQPLLHGNKLGSAKVLARPPGAGGSRARIWIAL